MQPHAAVFNVLFPFFLFLQSQTNQQQGSYYGGEPAPLPPVETIITDASIPLRSVDSPDSGIGTQFFLTLVCCYPSYQLVRTAFK